MQEDPLEVFEFMKANSIGIEYGVFHIAIALIKERRKNYYEADNIYREAIKKYKVD